MTQQLIKLKLGIMSPEIYVEGVLIISVVVVIERHHSWLDLVDDCVLKKV